MHVSLITGQRSKALDQNGVDEGVGLEEPTLRTQKHLED